MIQSDVFKRIRQIKIHTGRLVDDLFAGIYRSIFKGKGIEFEDFREYLPGDEIRSIDWNVSARMNNVFVKNYREERELTVMLVIDVSASSRFGSQNRTKSEVIAEVGALLAFSAIKNQDKVGLLLFSDIIEKYIPPKKGLRHTLRLIRELLAFKPKSTGTDLQKALRYLGRVQKRQCICFLISDFICQDYALDVKLAAKRYDLITIAITDPYETTFPDIGLTMIQDLETGEKSLVDTSNYTVQTHYASEASRRLNEFQKLIQKIGAGFISIKTNKPYTDALRKYFKERKKRNR